MRLYEREMNSRFGRRGDVRPGREARSDRDVRVPRDEGGDEREERVEIGREIDVHVSDDLGVARAPRLPQRASPTLAVEVDRVHTVELAGQLDGLRPGAVRGSVVDDRDAPREREAGGQVRVQSADAGSERGFLVEHRNDDVHHGRDRRKRDGTRDAAGEVRRGDGAALLHDATIVGAREPRIGGGEESGEKRPRPGADLGDDGSVTER